MREIEERELKGFNGWAALALLIAAMLLGIAMTVVGCIFAATPADGQVLKEDELANPAFMAMFAAGILVLVADGIAWAGLKVVAPNEAMVFTLFGKYHGTLKKDGFFYVVPFCVSVNPAAPKNAANKKISLKAMTLNNDKQKVNDEDGNPIEISVVVIWQIASAAKAVFSVENYTAFISTQCDSAIRQVARQYPYDVSDNGDEKSLRGSSMEVAEILKEELQSRVKMAGIEILEARINNLAYAPEIAAAMLQRQQAGAIIAARQKIVDGAVSMVEMALKKLADNDIVELDDERKAQMVSNLLVVLCGNRDAQPIVNSGSIY